MITETANYYSLFFIPIGILILAIAKFGSDLSFSDKRLIINSNDQSEIIPYTTKSELSAEISRIRTKNDKTFIFKEMSINVNELEILKTIKIKSEYLGPILELYGFGMIRNDLLLENVQGKVQCKYLIGRIVYEKFIETGDFKIGKSSSVSEFLKINYIETDANLPFTFRDNRRIVDFNNNLEHITYLPFVNNALILFLSLTGFIKVIN